MWLLVMFLYTSLLTNYLLKPLWFSYTYKTGIFVKNFLKVTKRVETSFREGMQTKVLCVVLTKHILYSNIPMALSIQLPVPETDALILSIPSLFLFLVFFLSLSPDLLPSLCPLLILQGLPHISSTLINLSLYLL